ncbi:MAG: hypothetical protein AAF663_02305 [Planctomycetota bacterium]
MGQTAGEPTHDLSRDPLVDAVTGSKVRELGEYAFKLEKVSEKVAIAKVENDSRRRRARHRVLCGRWRAKVKRWAGDANSPRWKPWMPLAVRDPLWADAKRTGLPLDVLHADDQARAW